MTEVIFGLLLLGPLALTLLLKSNAGLGFLTLCTGFVLSTSVIGDLKKLLSQMDLTATDSTIGLSLLSVPLVLTLLLTRKSAGSGLKLYIHLLVALLSGGLLALTAGPILTSSSSLDLTSSPYWANLQSAQSVIIGVGAFLSLTLVWLGKKHLGKKHK